MADSSWFHLDIFLNHDSWGPFPSPNAEKFWKLGQLPPSVFIHILLLSSLAFPASSCYPLLPQGRAEILTGAIGTIQI